MEIYNFIIQFFTILLGIFCGIYIAFLLMKGMRNLKEKRRKKRRRHPEARIKKKHESQKAFIRKNIKSLKRIKVRRSKSCGEISLKDRIGSQTSIKIENCYLDGLNYNREIKKGKKKEEDAYHYIDKVRKSLNKN